MPLPGYDLPPTVTMSFAGGQLAFARRQAKAAGSAIDSSFAPAPRGPALRRCVQPPQQRVENIGGTVADRKDFAGFFNFRRHALVFDQLDQIGRRKRGQSRMQKVALLAISPDDAPFVGRMRQIAARVPPDIRIFTPGRRFFSTSSVRSSACGRFRGRDQARGPAPTTTTSNEFKVQCSRSKVIDPEL